MAHDEQRTRPLRVLLVTARMGSGHLGVSRELVARLEAEGCVTNVIDFLDTLPAGVGAFMQRLYRAQLRYAPWSYDGLYRLRFRFSSAWNGINAFYVALTRGALSRRLDEFGPDVVVSLYPLAGTVLAQMRRAGAVAVPVATFITDFGVHPLWVHAGADRHLCVHEVAATEAARRTGGVSAAPGPVVAPSPARTRAARQARRDALGVPESHAMVVVSGGSWAIGDLARTVGVLAATGRIAPFVLCGRDDALRARIDAAGGIGLGWIDDVPSLLAAADALVDNAGGLTCMEAFAVGTPVVSYRPIAGHGRHNAAEMQRAGVTRYPRSAAGLVAVIDSIVSSPERHEAMLGAAAMMFSGDAAKDVMHLAALGRDRCR